MEITPDVSLDFDPAQGKLLLGVSVYHLLEMLAAKTATPWDDKAIKLLEDLSQKVKQLPAA